jgi:hypothetical protein
VLDEYDSSPGYFEPSAEPSAPIGGDPNSLAAAFETEDTALIEQILRKSSYDEDGYIFAVDRHRDLVRALGLPEWAVGTSYESLAGGELPEGLAVGDLKRST